MGLPIMLYSLDKLTDYIRNERNIPNPPEIVWTNGCYDILHMGHVKSFAEAKHMHPNCKLIVGINSDESIRRIKGPKRPIIDQTHRAQLLCSIRYVDAVIIFYEDTPIEIIKTIEPDVIIKGEDWRGKRVVGRQIVENRGGMVRFIDLYPHMSTSIIIDKIRGL